MSKIQKRLENGVAELQELESQRLETGLPGLGQDREFEIIARELFDLEQEIVREPGALAPQLVWVRKKRI